MKQLTFKKSTNQGLIEGILRVSGKFIYFKYNNTTQSKQAIDNFREKGIEIKEGKGWIQVDLLKDRESVNLGSIFIDTLEESDEQIEEKLFKFYKDQYTKLGFYIETQDDI